MMQKKPTRFLTHSWVQKLLRANHSSSPMRRWRIWISSQVFGGLRSACPEMTTLKFPLEIIKSLIVRDFIIRQFFICYYFRSLISSEIFLMKSSAEYASFVPSRFSIASEPDSISLSPITMMYGVCIVLAA